MSLAEKSFKWWQEVRSNEDATNDWLRKQYFGELTASQRIMWLALEYGKDKPEAAKILQEIANQEIQHARWVKELLDARGIKDLIEKKSSAYWEHTRHGIDSLESGAAAGAHAEEMRLERIKVIASDPDAPQDIRAVFQKILPQEEMHASAFRKIAGEVEFQKAAANHHKGLNALGLED